MLPGLAIVTVVMSPPPFASLDRTAGETGGGADLAFQSFEDSISDDGVADDRYAGRMDLFVEHALTDVFGLTASLPLVWTDVSYEDTWGIGAIRLGGYGRVRIADGHELVLRAGVQLPTESYPVERAADGVMMHAFAFQRLEDPALSSDAVWLRGGASYRLRLGDLAAQLDYLVDVPAGGDLDAATDRSPDGFAARVLFGGGVAYAPGRWAVAAEAVAAGFPYVDMNDCVVAPDVFEATFCEQISTVATLSARLHADPFVLSLWYSKALDDLLRARDVQILGLGARSSF